MKINKAHIMVFIFFVFYLGIGHYLNIKTFDQFNASNISGVLTYIHPVGGEVQVKLAPSDTILHLTVLPNSNTSYHFFEKIAEEGVSIWKRPYGDTLFLKHDSLIAFKIFRYGWLGRSNNLDGGTKRPRWLPH